MEYPRGISVIMPCYNAGAYIRDAVNSVYAQDFDRAPYEIIVVDDGSMADTRKIVESLRGTKDNLSVILLEKNLGPSGARNTALDVARYKYVLPLDSDDLLATQWKKKNGRRSGLMHQAFDAMEKSADLMIVYSDGLLFGAVNSEWILAPYSEKGLLVGNMIPNFGMYRLEEAKRAGGYTTSLKGREDWDFWLKLLNQRTHDGKKAQVTKLKDRLYLYRQHAHGQNVNASHGIRLVDFYKGAIGRYPDLYGHHFPHISPETLPHVLRYTASAYSPEVSLKSAFTNATLLGKRILRKIRREAGSLFGEKPVNPLPP